MTKQQILDEIRRTAKENGGQPLGVDRLKKETIIRDSDWKKYWIRLSDAHKELGLVPQLFGVRKHSDVEMMMAIANFVKDKGAFPTASEWDFGRDTVKWRVYQRRFGSKAEVARKLIDFCQALEGFEKVIELSKPIAIENEEEVQSSMNSRLLGHVYLLKSGKFYKIGKTNEVGRRNREINIELPEESKVIHSISTDDPAGIESYWHRRFAEKRKKGEWFELSLEDVRTFRKRSFM